MNAIDVTLGKAGAAVSNRAAAVRDGVVHRLAKKLVARVDAAVVAGADRPDAIRAELAAEVPEGMRSLSAKLTAVRQERSHRFELLRAAIHKALAEGVNKAGPDSPITLSKTHMEAIDPEIDDLRVQLQDQREALSPQFNATARTLFPSIAEQLEQALRILTAAGAELAAIDDATAAAGLSPLNRAGLFPSLPHLRILIEDLRN